VPHAGTQDVIDRIRGIQGLRHLQSCADIPPMLVTASELCARLSDPSLVLFDCRHDLTDHSRGAQLYGEGHIPGAHFAAVETDLSGPKSGTNGRHPLPSPEAFRDFLHARGVTSDSTIVAYDDAGGSYAARLWWLARWIGLRNVVLLDGGMQAWIAGGHPITSESTESKPSGSPLDIQLDSSLVLSATEVISSLPSGSPALLDARSAERFRGDSEPIDPVAGHIPGALNRFHKLNLNPNLTLRPAADLRSEYLALLGGRAPGGIVHYCGSGVTACCNLFAMEYAGLAGSRLYAGSWSEWVADRNRPVETGAS